MVNLGIRIRVYLTEEGSPEVNKSGYVGQVSIPANGEYAYLLARGCDEDDGQKLETLLGSGSL